MRKFQTKTKIKTNLPEYKEVKVSELKLANYQRTFKTAKIKPIAENFDFDILGIVLVSMRDGCYWIIDGQHRIEALKLIGVEKVMCQILKGLTYEQEASKFHSLNTQRTPLNSNQKFHAKVEMKDKNAIAIVNILEGNGFTYAKNNSARKENCIACMAKLTKIQSCNGNAGLDRVMRILRHTWCGEVDSVSPGIIQGISTFIGENSNINDSILSSALEKYQPKKILQQATIYANNEILRPARTDGTCYHVCKIIRDKYNEVAPKELRVL